MRSFGFKSGIGTASRKIKCGEKTYVLGAMVLNNMGVAGDLRIDGVPIGRMLTERQSKASDPTGSIIMIIGTDAPLASWELKRVARRVSFGLARTGGMATHGSGDIALAFSTASRTGEAERYIDEFFRACIESVEEAIINSLLRAYTVVGRDGNTASAIPIDAVVELLMKHRGAG